MVEMHFMANVSVSCNSAYISSCSHYNPHKREMNHSNRVQPPQLRGMQKVHLQFADDDVYALPIRTLLVLKMREERGRGAGFAKQS